MAEAEQDGRMAWFICFGSFIINFLVPPLTNCSGIIMSAMIDNYQVSRTEAAWVSSLPTSCLYLFAPLSTFSCNRFGARKTVTLGAIITVAALIISSFATNFGLLYFSYGVCGGLGVCLFYFPTFVMISKCFKDKISTANGIATAGSSIGTFVLSPVIQQLFSRLGMSNGFRVLASFHILLCIPVLMFRPSSTSTTTTNPHQHEHKWLNIGVFKSANFLIWMVAVFIFQLNYSIPYIHLARLGEDVGASKVMASLLISILAGGSLLGRVLCGRLADLACCNRLNICQLSLLCIAVTTTLVGFAPSFTWVGVYAVLFGVSEGVFVMVFMVITRDIVGTENLAFALGIAYFMLAIPKTVGPLIAGFMFDISRNYVLAFMIMGGLTAFSAILMFLINIKKSHKRTIGITSCSETNV